MSAHDLWEPKLRIRASGFGGSGYALPNKLDALGKPSKVPGVTTVLGALPKGGLVQWSVDNTVAYMLTNLDRILDLEDTVAFRKFRFYHSRRPDVDSPDLNPYNAHAGVLDDAAQNGTRVHDWIAAYVTGEEIPELDNDLQAEAVQAFLDWESEHEIMPVLTEVTVVNEAVGYAGTLDHIWYVDGKLTLLDVKTSKRVYDSHVAQVAALSRGEYLLREVDAGTPGAVEYTTKKWGETWWLVEPMPEVEQVAILRCRYSDFDKDGDEVPAHSEYHVIRPEALDVGWDLFTGARALKTAEFNWKKMEKTYGRAYY